MISDRASRGEYSDKSGKAINDFLNRTVRSNWIAVMKIVPDESRASPKRWSKCPIRKIATSC